MVDEVNIISLQKQLFDSKNDVYAVVDGALLPNLLAKLEEYAPKNTCLFRGELPFDLAEAAPYLVKLEKDKQFTKWLVNESVEEPCCIYAQTTVKDDFIHFRKHFRSFLRVESPEGKSLLFRYYDPRVFKTYLPTCTPGDNDILFNDIDSYLLFNEDDKSFQRFKMPVEEEVVEVSELEEQGKGSIEAGLPKASETEVEEEKTVLMKVKPPQTPTKEEVTANSSKLPSAEGTDISEEKTVIMRIQPKK